MKKFTSIILFACFVMLLFTPTTFATVQTNDAKAKPDVSGNLYQVGTGGYVEATNSFDDGSPEYWLLTQDSTKSGDTSVTYNGNSYPLAGVKVITATDSIAALTDLWPASSYNVVNRTVFIDGGTYNDDSGYYQFSQENLSLVGLDPGNKPVFVRKKAGTSSGWFGYDFIHRHGINSPDVYFANIIFDGNAMQLENNSHGRALFVVSGGKDATGVQTSKGAQDFVMKDCELTNIGASTFSWSCDNSAIQLLYGDNQTNIEGLKISNVKTTLMGNPVFHTNAKANTFIRDLNMDSSAAATNTHGLRIENTYHSNHLYAIPVVDNSVYMDGTNVLSTGFVQIEDYTYDKINIPMDYRYIEYYESNSDENVGTYRVHNDYSQIPEGRAKLDRVDNYWVVDENLSVSVSDQIAAIDSVRKYMKGVVNDQGVAMNPDRIPPFNVKLVVKDGDVNNFDIPAQVTDEINIVAVNTLTESAHDADTIISTQAGFTGTFNNTGATNLYNFDFETSPNYTVQETIDGITRLTPGELMDHHMYPAGQNLLYDEYAPVADTPPAITAANPTEVTFNNCKFVGLVEKLQATAPSSTLEIGETTTVAATPTAVYTAKNNLSNIETATANDETIYYMSTDPTIATVDPVSGLVTAVAPGTVTIVAKAKDSFNDGEIEKPFAEFPMTVKKKTEYVTIIVEATGGTAKEEKVVVVKGESTTVSATADSGYTLDYLLISCASGKTTKVLPTDPALKKDKDNNYTYTIDSATEPCNVHFYFVKDKNPDTGDYSGGVLIGGLLLLSVGAMVFTRKRNLSK